VTALAIPDPADRDDLGAFTARIVRLDPVAPVRLRREDRAGEAYVTAWAPTPFDALATRAVRGDVEPGDVTVAASALLTALAVDRAATVDPGPPVISPLGELPPQHGWSAVEEVPAGELEQLAERGLAMARANAGPLGPPASLLDQTVLTVSAVGSPSQPLVKVPLRCLFALSGMGFLGAGATDAVRVSATGAWLRLDARFGAVVRRRITSLPLIVT
jgi:hypothetical protein